MFTTISESVAAYDDMLNDNATYRPLMRSALFEGYQDAAELNEGDPIAYKCGWIDYMDSLEVDTDSLEDDYTFDRDRM